MTGAVTEAEYRERWKDALHLSEPEADEFMRDLWDWYCGELVSYATGLRPTYVTAILMAGVLHQSTPASIRAIDALLG